MPTKIWNEKRLAELEEAIFRRLTTNFQIPIDWIMERNKLVSEISIKPNFSETIEERYSHLNK